MMKKMNDKKKYALISQLVVDNPDVKKLTYLPAFNEFTNYMVNYYSFKISREDAKNKPLEKEEIINEKGFKLASISRFAKPMKYIYNNRRKLNEKKYSKYRILGASKENDILSKIANLDMNKYQDDYNH